MLNIKRYIGDKAFYKATLAVALPLMLQQLITNSVNLVDNLMVGQLGDAALAGVASVNKFYLIATFAINGLLATAAIFIAQYHGANQEEKMKESFRFSILFSFGITLFFFVVAKCFTGSIVGFFTIEADIIEQGILYLQIAAFTFIPMAITLCMANSLRAIGQMKIPLYISIVAVITNTFLNYCLIFGHFGFQALGVQGAAIATLVARSLEAFLFLIVMKFIDVPFKTRVRDLFKVSKDLSKKIFIKALPLSINEVLWQGGTATLFKLYGTRGAEVIAGYSISNTIADIFFVLFAGMAAATTVLVSRNLGANRLEEGKENGYRLLGFSVMLSFLFAILMFSAAHTVPHFYQVSIASKDVATNVLTIMSGMFWIYMVNTQCYFILRAGGDMRSTLIIDSLYMWTINIPLVALVAYLTDVNIYVLYVIGQSTDLLKMIICMKMVKKEKWVVNLTTHDETE